MIVDVNTGRSVRSFAVDIRPEPDFRPFTWAWEVEEIVAVDALPGLPMAKRERIAGGHALWVWTARRSARRAIAVALQDGEHWTVRAERDQ